MALREPSPAEWDHAGRGASALTRKALTGYLGKVAEKRCGLELAALMGATFELGALARAVTRPEGLLEVEDMLLACLRGAIRGQTDPTREDGSPWMPPGHA